MWKDSVDYFTLDILGLSGKINDVVNFFIYDTIKIWFLLITIIFVVSYLRTHFNTEYVRAYLQGKSEFTGNVLAALFGIITPFCSCSAIPLFLGFIQARIPIGVTFSFLISSPMNNEIAIALLMIGFCIPAAPYMQAAGRILPPKVRNIISVKHVERHDVLIAAKDIAPVYTCSVGDVAKGTVKLFERVNENLMYFFTLPALIGVYSYFKRTKKRLKTFLPASFIVFYLIIMHLLYYDYSYISRRHCLPLAVMLVFFVPDGLDILSKWLSRNVFKSLSFAREGSSKLFVALLVLGIMTCVSKLLTPLGSDKEGYIAAAKWLKENSPKDASVFCADIRISFYADRKKTSIVNKYKLPLGSYIVDINKIGGKTESTESEYPAWFIKKHDDWVDPKKRQKQIAIYKLI